MDYFLYATSKNGINSIITLLYCLFLHSLLRIFIHTTFLIHCKHWDTEIFAKKWKDNKILFMLLKKVHCVFWYNGLLAKGCKTQFSMHYHNHGNCRNHFFIINSDELLLSLYVNIFTLYPHYVFLMTPCIWWSMLWPLETLIKIDSS